MRRLPFLLFSCFSTVFAGPPGPPASAWKELFDGRSFAGWRSPSGKTDLGGAWRIEHGTLTVRPQVQHRTDLWTVDEYDNFEMEWEWRATPGANSGVKYWVERASTLVVIKEDVEWKRIADPSVAEAGDITIEYSHGPEYQLAAPDEPSAVKSPVQRAGGLYGIIAPQPEAVRPAGQWNRSRLVVNRGRIEHWLNGRRVVDTTPAALTAPNRQRGPIALQYHQTEVAFRSIRVRPL